MGGRYSVIQFMPKALVGKDRNVTFFSDMKNSNKMAGSMFKAASSKQLSKTVEGWSLRTFLNMAGAQRSDYVHLWFNCEGAEFEAIRVAMGDGLICSSVDSMSIFLHYKLFLGTKALPFHLWTPEELVEATVRDPSCRTASLYLGPGKTDKVLVKLVKRSRKQYPDAPW